MGSEATMATRAADIESMADEDIGPRWWNRGQCDLAKSGGEDIKVVKFRECKRCGEGGRQPE